MADQIFVVIMYAYQAARSQIIVILLDVIMEIVGVTIIVFKERLYMLPAKLGRFITVCLVVVSQRGESIITKIRLIEIMTEHAVAALVTIQSVHQLELMVLVQAANIVGTLL